MTLPANPRRDRYVANQGQTVFPYTFRIFAASDLVVERLRNNTTTTLQLNTDYTVSGVGNNTGGNVTLTQGAQAGDIIAIVSNQPNQRSTDFTESGDFRAAAVNAEFDRIWIGIQQVAQDVSRQITRPLSDPTASYVLPPAAVRANRYLAFGADGSLTFPVPQPAGPGTTEAYWWGGTAGGTANALTISVGGPPTAYAEGQRFAFVVASNNTGTATLNVNGLGAVAINRPNGNVLQAGDLVAGELVGVTYVGSTFWLSSPLVPERQIITADLTNSTVIDVTGFSLQNYRKVTILVLGASLSSASSNNILAEIFRNGSLVTTGYFFVRETAAGTTMTVGSNNNHPLFGLTSNGVNTNPLISVIDIVQPGSTGDVVLYAYTVHRDSPTGNINNYRTGVIINGGSGWTNGVRITAPTAFVANAGRIVVMGLRP